MIHLYTYHHDGEVIHEHYTVYYHTVDYSKCCKTFLVNKNNNKKMFNNIKSRTEQGINYIYRYKWKNGVKDVLEKTKHQQTTVFIDKIHTVFIHVL